MKKLFRADYKYADRSYKYVEEYPEWEYKEHKYSDVEYFNILNVGDVGEVIREYNSENLADTLNIYDAEIILKDEEDKIIVFLVDNMRYNGYAYLQKLERIEKLNQIMI